MPHTSATVNTPEPATPHEAPNAGLVWLCWGSNRCRLASAVGANRRHSYGLALLNRERNEDGDDATCYFQPDFIAGVTRAFPQHQAINLQYFSTGMLKPDSRCVLSLLLLRGESLRKNNRGNVPVRAFVLSKAPVFLSAEGMARQQSISEELMSALHIPCAPRGSAL